MSEIIQIAFNAVSAKLINPSRELKLQTQAILSYAVAGAEHMSAFKSGSWDGRSSFFDFANATFPRGFVVLVQHHLTKLGYRVQTVKKPFPEPLGATNPVVDDFPEEARYDYQPQVIEKLLKNGQIIAQIATGGGKSRIAKLAVARINRPTLFLTTRGVLMYQMAEGFESLNKDVAILGDGNIRTSKEITCGMVQTIASWLETTTAAAEMEKIASAIVNREEKQLTKYKEELKKNKMPLEVISAELNKFRMQLEKQRPSNKDSLAKANAIYTRQLKRNATMKAALLEFEFVILEEAHESSGNNYFDILKHCKNAHYRLSLTATPFMKDSEEANMRLMASSGHVALKVSEEMLIERGILAKPYFKYAKTIKSDKLYKSTPWQKAYEVGIVESETRNKHIVAETMRAARYGLPTMVLVQHTKHGERLNALMQANGLRTIYIQGEDNQAERKYALNLLKNREIDALIGTNILDVGVDVPAVGLIVLAGGGKAEVALRQRIGRGLRAKKSGPNIAFVLDFADDYNNHLKMHYLTRRGIVESTPGFAENIVNDFDYTGLGFCKVI